MGFPRSDGHEDEEDFSHQNTRPSELPPRTARRHQNNQGRQLRPTTAGSPCVGPPLATMEAGEGANRSGVKLGGESVECPTDLIDRVSV